jgi:hypothetical protein
VNVVLQPCDTVTVATNDLADPEVMIPIIYRVFHPDMNVSISAEYNSIPQ